MKLPSFLEKVLPLKKEEKEYFLALEIKSQEVKAAVWQKDEEKISLINLGAANFEGDWEEVVRAADEAIVEASGAVSQEKIEKVILGLPQDWTVENKITASRLNDLKKLCAQLSLKPLGFVVIPEAIVNYLRQLEGVPPTAILIGPETESFTLTLVKAGKIEGTKVVRKSQEKKLSEQIEEVLAGFTVEALPSRVLLYNGRDDLEKLEENLLSHRWTDKLPFLHLPKIELLEKSFDIRALAMASGMQMGGIIIQEEMVMEKEPEIEEDKEEQEEIVSVGASEKEDFGFVKDRDILEDEGEEEEMVAEVEEAPEETVSREASEAEIFKPSLPSLKFKLPSFKLPSLGFSLFGGVVKPLILAVLVLVFIGGASFAAWWYLPKAEVKIWVQTKPLEKEAEVTLSQSSEGSPEATGLTIEVEEEASKKSSATGKKTVGDPAKGKTVIYNKTENEKKFPQGTVLIGPDEARFTLDEEVTVASTAAFSTSFSSVNGKITAVKIGPEGNLPGDTNLSFKDFPTSSYFAKTDGDLSGGTSKEVSAIAKADQEKLLEELSGELTNKAKEDLQAKLGSEEKLVEDTVALTVKEKKFDKEVGEEAAELNLTLSATFKALAYNEKEIKDHFLKSLEEATPPGYELAREETKIEIVGVNKKEKETTLKMVAKAKLLPKLNLEEIRKNIVGKKKTLAEEYLRNLDGVSQVEIIIKFPLPLGLGTLPRLPQNITLEAIST